MNLFFLSVMLEYVVFSSFSLKDINEKMSFFPFVEYIVKKQNYRVHIILIIASIKDFSMM